MEVYWSRDDTLAPNDGIKVSPSFNHINRRGESPRETPQIVRVRIPSAKPSWKENGSITGGTLYRFVKFKIHSDFQTTDRDEHEECCIEKKEQ